MIFIILKIKKFYAFLMLLSYVFFLMLIKSKILSQLFFFFLFPLTTHAPYIYIYTLFNWHKIRFLFLKMFHARSKTFFGGFCGFSSGYENFRTTPFPFKKKHPTTTIYHNVKYEWVSRAFDTKQQKNMSFETIFLQFKGNPSVHKNPCCSLNSEDSFSTTGGRV